MGNFRVIRFVVNGAPVLGVVRTTDVPTIMDAVGMAEVVGAGNSPAVALMDATGLPASGAMFKAKSIGFAPMKEAA